MSKIKLTKGELKKQRDSLKQFKHYLPTLQLKKQQLQMKILETRQELDRLSSRLTSLSEGIEQWAGLLSSDALDLKPFMQAKEIKVGNTNIAGAEVPVFETVIFEDIEYDLFQTPIWVDKAISEIQGYVKIFAAKQVMDKQLQILEKELRTTTQRVNLFEKVKIPECKENIRRISIYLGDQMANAVGIGKVAKKKVLEAEVVS